MRFTLFMLCFCRAMNSGAQTTEALHEKFPVDSGYFASFDGTKIYYESSGKGKPVLLVHGFIVNSSSWKKANLYTDLLKKGYQVILLDLRGNGKSGKPHDSTAYDNDAEAKDVMLLMDRLNVKQYAAIGYSRGSIITARLLVLDNRATCGVIGGMGIAFTNPEWPRRKMFYRALMGDDIPELKPAMDYITQQKLDRLALAWMQRSQPSTSKEALSKLKQPILVIWGDKDNDSSSATELAKLFQHATSATTPGDHGGANHTPEFSQAVSAFLKKYYR